MSAMATRREADAPAWIEIDLGAIARNAARLAARAHTPIVAMVKSDAYGLGAIEVARALGAPFLDAPDGIGVSDTSGATPRMPSGVPLWGLGVASLAEAEVLRDAGCTARILCMTPLIERDLVDAAALGVTPSLHRVRDIARWSGTAGTSWHLSIDTGMSRAGVRWDEVTPLRDAIRAHCPEGVYTHFHSAGRDAAAVAQQD